MGWEFNEFYNGAINKGFIYSPPVTDGACNSRIVRDGVELINFSGINFLGLQEDKKIVEHFCDSARKFGLVTGGSRATQGISRAHLELEQMMCELQNKPYTLTFGTGLLANIGFIQAMTMKFQFDSGCDIDNRDVIFVLDRDSHWSLWKAASHLKFGEQLFSFRHNDPDDLDRILSRARGKKVVVVFESVYSSDGSIAPISEIIDVCEKYDALSYCDDANGFMVYGSRKMPFYQQFSEMKRATFLMVSFSKSIGMEGGAISGPTEYVGAFEVLSGTSLFTASIQPATANTIIEIMNFINENPVVMENYLRRCENFRHKLLQKGFILNSDPSYITSIFIGNDDKAEIVRCELLSRGFCVPIFRYPAVKPNKSVMRLIINNQHRDDDINYFIDNLVEVRDKHIF